MGQTISNIFGKKTNVSSTNTTPPSSSNANANPNVAPVSSTQPSGITDKMKQFVNNVETGSTVTDYKKISALPDGPNIIGSNGKLKPIPSGKTSKEIGNKYSQNRDKGLQERVQATLGLGYTEFGGKGNGDGSGNLSEMLREYYRDPKTNPEMKKELETLVGGKERINDIGFTTDPKRQSSLPKIPLISSNSGEVDPSKLQKLQEFFNKAHSIDKDNWENLQDRAFE